ncbi:unnamed protein product [Adineta steineri]|nr:unnamed protein product [Adineta steineri]
MIKNIQETAATTKTRLLYMINEEKDQIKNRFTLVANELKANQSESDFVETDVQEWQKKLRDCKQKFEQLMVQNNDLIDIDIKLMDVKDSISINRKSDVKIQTRFNDQFRETIYEKPSNHQTSQNSFRKNARCAELRSANRFHKKPTNDSDDYCNSARDIINGDIYHDETEDIQLNTSNRWLSQMEENFE